MDFLYSFFLYPFGTGIAAGILSTILSFVSLIIMNNKTEQIEPTERSSYVQVGLSQFLMYLIPVECTMTFIVFAMFGILDIVKIPQLPGFAIGIVTIKIIFVKKIFG